GLTKNTRSSWFTRGSAVSFELGDRNGDRRGSPHATPGAVSCVPAVAGPVAVPGNFAGQTRSVRHRATDAPARPPGPEAVSRVVGRRTGRLASAHFRKHAGQRGPRPPPRRARCGAGRID